MYGINTAVKSEDLRFGLNKVTITDLEWRAPEGDYGASINIVLSAGYDSIREVTRAFDKKNGGAEVTDVNHPVFKQTVAYLNQKVTQLMLCFVSKEELQEVFSEPIRSFEQYARIVISTIKNSDAFKAQQEVYVMARYKWNKEEEDPIARVEIGRDAKHGVIYCTGEGEYTRNPDHSGYEYINEKGDILAINRSAWWATSNFGDSREIKKGGDLPADY